MNHSIIPPSGCDITKGRSCISHLRQDADMPEAMTGGGRPTSRRLRTACGLPLTRKGRLRVTEV